jgi:hypothetical protein
MKRQNWPNCCIVPSASFVKAVGKECGSAAAGKGSKNFSCGEILKGRILKAKKSKVKR